MRLAHVQLVNGAVFDRAAHLPGSLVHKQRVNFVLVLVGGLHHRSLCSFVFYEIGAALQQRLANERLYNHSWIHHAQAERVHASTAQQAPYIQLDCLADRIVNVNVLFILTLIAKLN